MSSRHKERDHKSSRHDRDHGSRSERDNEERSKETKRRKEENGDDLVSKKKSRFDVDAENKVIEEETKAMMTPDEIKAMMNKAKADITQRKQDLNIKTSNDFYHEAMEKAKKAADIQARIQANWNLPSLSNVKLLPNTLALKPGALILDESGRTVDAKTGEVVDIKSSYVPTLKANIRAKRREQFKTALEKPVTEENQESKFFDPRVSLKNRTRYKASFKFHEKGKFESQALKLRTKAQLEKLQNEISLAAKKTGIASAAKLASLLPKKDIVSGVPDVEWWDAYIMSCSSYDEFFSIDESSPEAVLTKYDQITSLVEHPTQLRPPAESDKAIVIPIMLTKKERKKLRRQNRAEAQKELTEKIRLGLLPPPEPKVKMANLMRVLGTDAVQDPTKVEAHVRAQMAKRQKAHEEANAARKLTPQQRKEKKAKKLQEDTSNGVEVAVYKVSDLQDPAKKFKVETNAKQLYMTGLVVAFKDCNCVAVEGGPKQQKKFKRLMLNRIKWGESSKHKPNAEQDPDDSDDDAATASNTGKHCELVWQGEVPQRAFNDLRFKVCPTEAFAREQFKRRGVEHYWNLAYSTAILQISGQDVL